MFLLCFKIFLARVFDVTLGTIRTMFVVKERKYIAAFIAFFEVIIWFYAARTALNTNSSSLYIAIFYALGYATGTLLGSFINELFINGVYSIQVISKSISNKDLYKIRKKGFAYSVTKTVDDKNIIILEVNKKKYKECIKTLKKIDNKCFIVVSESKIAYNGFIK